MSKSLPKHIKELADACNERQVAVVQAVLSGDYPNKTRAYMSVFTETSADSARASVAKLLAQPSVSALYDALKDYHLEKRALSRSEAIDILTDLARSDLGSLVEFTTQTVKNNDGEPVEQSCWRFKDSNELAPAQRRTISELTAGTQGLKIKTHDPKAAIKQLSDMMGWNEPTKLEVTNLEYAGDILFKKSKE